MQIWDDIVQMKTCNGVFWVNLWIFSKGCIYANFRERESSKGGFEFFRISLVFGGSHVVRVVL